MLRTAWHPSLRVKLTAAFAGAMTVLLVGLGLFIFHTFAAGLDGSLDQSLRLRAGDVRALNAQADTGLADARGALTDTHQIGFAQVLSASGRILDATPGYARVALLTPAERRRGTRSAVLLDRRHSRAGAVRLFVTSTLSQDRRPLLIVVGVSLRSRDAALQELSAVLLLGGPFALLLTSLLGYTLAAVALRSVETLRRRASELSVTEPGTRLPVPPASDELRRLALTLNEMLERNEVAFARERRFIADASHELRTPLSVLKAELEVAATGDSSERELRAALRSAGVEADRLIRLAQDLLALGRAEHGGRSVELRATPVRDLFAAVAERFAVLADLRSGPLSVMADPAQLDQALTNLVENALRHGGGTVSLHADVVGERVELHVEDDGPGFPPDFLAVAFEPFARAESSRTSEGAGLGLAIARGIAHAHGGEIHAVNRGGGGADVWLTLRLAGPTGSGDAPAPVAAASRPLARPSR